MKHFLLVSLLVSIVCCAYSNNAPTQNNASTKRTADNVKTQIKSCKPTIDKGEYLYEIKNNEILVNDKLITLISFGKNISVAYRNKKNKTMKPAYTIKVYNSYGMLLGKDELGSSSLTFFGSSTYMEPGEVGSERIHLDEYPVTEILKFSSIKIPNDVLERKWVIISDTNTK